MGPMYSRSLPSGSSFAVPDFEDLARKLKAKAIFDGRNLYDPATVRAAGLQYFGIGRGS